MLPTYSFTSILCSPLKAALKAGNEIAAITLTLRRQKPRDRFSKLSIPSNEGVLEVEYRHVGSRAAHSCPRAGAGRVAQHPAAGAPCRLARAGRAGRLLGFHLPELPADPALPHRLAPSLPEPAGIFPGYPQPGIRLRARPAPGRGGGAAPGH